MNTLISDDYEDRCTECGASFEFHMTHPWSVYLVKKNPVQVEWIYDDMANVTYPSSNYEVHVCYSYKMRMA